MNVKVGQYWNVGAESLLSAVGSDGNFHTCSTHKVLLWILNRIKIITFFNWNHFIPCQNKHWNQNQLQKNRFKVKQASEDVSKGKQRHFMRSCLLFWLGILDHLIPFFFQSQTLTWLWHTPKSHMTPKSDTTSVASSTPLLQAQPGWAFLALKRGKKNPVKFKKYLQCCLLLISWLQAGRK